MLHSNDMQDLHSVYCQVWQHSEILYSTADAASLLPEEFQLHISSNPTSTNAVHSSDYHQNTRTFIVRSLIISKSYLDFSLLLIAGERRSVNKDTVRLVRYYEMEIFPYILE